MFRQSLVFVHAAPQGGPDGLFLLDTGAEATVIDQQLAAAAQLHLGRGVDLDAAGGELGARRTGAISLNLEGGPVVRADAAVTDLSAPAKAMGLPLAGVLGMDALARFVLQIDYAAGAVRLAEPGDLPMPAGQGAGLGADLRVTPLPFVRAVVTRQGCTVEGEFQLDTGSNTAVEFWGPFAARAFPGARGAPGAGLGAGGPEVTERSRIDALEVAGRRIPDLAVNLADETRPSGAGETYAGVIGAPAWAGRVLTLDFPNRRMGLS